VGWKPEDEKPLLMPAECYDVDRGDYSFLSVMPNPLDLKLQQLTRRFAAEDPEGRLEMTAAISPDQQNTLLHFAKRSAVLAVRENKSSWCEVGLVAMAMVDETQIDWRDAWSPAGLLSYAMAAVGADREALVDHALSLSRSGMRKPIESVKRPSPLSGSLYAEVQEEDGGWGLFGKGSEPYAPTLDLTRLALRIAAEWREGRYTAEPEVAEKLPAVWSAEEHRQEVERVAKRARAGIKVRGTLRKGQGAPPISQLLLVWVIELPDERDANLLISYWGNSRPDTFTVGMARGPLFSLLVAGSCYEGVGAFETEESVAVLSQGIGRLLEETLKTSTVG
jgi:hypothetical protein